jgi:tetratricopeptide (TPR) repeat protein
MTQAAPVSPVRADRTLHGASVALALAIALAVGFAGCSSAPAEQRNAMQISSLATSQSAARALSRGDLAQARALYERALASADAVEDFALAGALLNNLALVHQRSAERDSGAARARELMLAHGRVDRLLGAPQRYGPALHAAAAARKAMLHLDAGEADAATRWADTAASSCAAPCAHAATLALLRAQIAWLRGDATGALGHAEAAVAAATAQPHDTERANALRQRGRAASRLGQAAQAAADLAQALAIDHRLGLPERIALDLVWAGDVEHRRGDAAAAREFYERALVVYQAAGLTALADRVRERLASGTAVNKP